MASLWGVLTRTYDGYILPIRFPYNRTCGNWYRGTQKFLWPMGPKQSMVTRLYNFPSMKKNTQKKINGIHGCTVNIPDIYQAVPNIPNKWFFGARYLPMYGCTIQSAPSMTYTNSPRSPPVRRSSWNRAACLDSTILWPPTSAMLRGGHNTMGLFHVDVRHWPMASLRRFVHHWWLDSGTANALRP